MLRLRSLGRTVVGTVRGLLARSFDVGVPVLRPVGAALAAGAGAVSRTARPILHPLRRLARPLKGLSRDLAGLVPALLAGAGVFLVVAGLFNYFSPAVEPNPSPTDVAQAPDPSWHYVVVSLRLEVASVRSFRIVDGLVEEEPIEVPL